MDGIASAECGCLRGAFSGEPVAFALLTGGAVGSVAEIGEIHFAECAVPDIDDCEDGFDFFWLTGENFQGGDRFE